MSKFCNICNSEKATSEFSKRSIICKKCSAIREQTIRINNKNKAIDFLGGCCVVCKSKKALEFHHINPDEKENQVSLLFSRRDFDKGILPEVKKCVLLCRNCHKIKHIENGRPDTFKGKLSVNSLKKACKHHGLTIFMPFKVYDKSRKVYDSHACMKRIYENQSKRKEEKRRFVYENFNGVCEICNETDIRVMELHHKDPKEKEFSLGDMRESWDKIKKELQKCIMVCGNCHMGIHNG